MRWMLAATVLMSCTAMGQDAAKTLSVEQAQALVQAAAQRQDVQLKLDEFATLSNEAAKVLGTHEGGHLSLNGLTSLSEESATALARQQVLFLNGLNSLDGKVAKALARQKGHLHLNGLTTLSAATATALGQHEGHINLEGVTALSDEAAQGLAQHKGRVFLDSLTNLSSKAAQSLRANPSIRLP